MQSKLVMYDTAGQAVARYHLEHAWPQPTATPRAGLLTETAFPSLGGR